MSYIDEVIVEIDGQKTLYKVQDTEQRTSDASVALQVADLQVASAKHGEDIDTLKSAATGQASTNTSTAATLKDHDSRITKAQNTADSNATKASALSKVVESNTQSIAAEAARAKAVEGERDQLTPTVKDTLVAAINWVHTRAEKALENIGTLADLATSEKTDVVRSINELVSTVASNKSSIESTVAANKTSIEKTVAANKSAADTSISALEDQIGNVKLSITSEGLLHIEEKEA